MKRIVLLSSILFFSLTAFSQTKTVVYFNSSESTVLEPAQRTLDSLANKLHKATKYRLTLNGYCDSTGKHDGNITLARQRASTVFDYLASHGVSGDSMVRNGFAESDPAAPGSDAASKAKNRRVEILVSSSGSFAGARRFDASTPLSDLQVGQQLVLRNLNFVNNQAILLTECIPTIRELLKYMQDNPSLVIKLNGHVCCTYDMELSIRRAKFVYDYLQRNGIDPTRMSYAGYSNTMPLMPHDDLDPEAAKVNRRVEITIVSK